MFIAQMYKYKLDDKLYVSANVPEGAELLETQDILCAEEGYELLRKSDNENVSSCIWLRDGDVQENYTEIEAPKDVDESVVD